MKIGPTVTFAIMSGQSGLLLLPQMTCEPPENYVQPEGKSKNLPGPLLI
jgi:hypothetical protein